MSSSTAMSLILLRSSRRWLAWKVRSSGNGSFVTPASVLFTLAMVMSASSTGVSPSSLISSLVMMSSALAAWSPLRAPAPPPPLRPERAPPPPPDTLVLNCRVPHWLKIL